MAEDNIYEPLCFRPLLAVNTKVPRLRIYADALQQTETEMAINTTQYQLRRFFIVPNNTHDIG